MKYWLIKSEPDAYSIDDLARDTTEPWTGVRNFQARNFMRDAMQHGDFALYYHSSVQPAGVVGLAKITSAPYPDPTQFDQSSEYFDPKAKPESPIWILVDVSFVKKFSRMVTLHELQANPITSGMRVCQRGNRLSITPVTEAEFKEIEKMASDV